MKHDVTILEPDVSMPQFLQLLEITESVPLAVTGGSMNPFLVSGRDTVYLSRVRGFLKRGDMALYRRDNGRYVLHRVYRAEDARYVMLGDAQTASESGIRQDQILAVVTAVRRKDRLMRPGCFWWIFFEKFWIRMVPLRPLLLRAYTRVIRFFHKTVTAVL